MFIFFLNSIALSKVFKFFTIFGGHKSFLCDYSCPFFWLLVMSPLGFKARVGSIIHPWWRCTCYTFAEVHLWCNTLSPLGNQHGSQAVLLHVPANRYWWGSKLGSIMLLLTGRQKLNPLSYAGSAKCSMLCYLLCRY